MADGLQEVLGVAEAALVGDRVDEHQSGGPVEDRQQVGGFLKKRFLEKD